MRNSEVALVFSFMVLSSLAYATLADCPTCAGETPNWTASAISFLEGKPVNDIPSGLNGAQQARLIDAQIDSNKKSNQASNEAGSLAASPIYSSTSALKIVLDNISAMPNPSNLGDPVNITAIFGNNSTKAAPNNLSNIMNPDGLMVYANMKNAAGIEVGRVNLKQVSGNVYTGIWYASVDSGTYDVTIDVSGQHRSKIFDKALQIVINGSRSTARNIYAMRKLG